MKKTKTKLKETEAGSGGARSQVVKLKPGKAKVSWFKKIPPVKSYAHTVTQFISEVVSELKKVIWPNRKETLGTTGVVLILVILSAAYLGMVDYLLSHIVRLLID
ncbi:MAG: preprotein translocase subunit SecE [Deltaproteobacteria bacterium]|nr:preprotein translocase subunit SecE [Deltaproteobacteria bacterium]